MKLLKMILISFLAHFFWAFVVLYSGVKLIYNSPIFFEILVEPYMTLVFFPIITNLIVYYNFIRKPLESKTKKIIFIIINTLFTFGMYFWLVPVYI